MKTTDLDLTGMKFGKLTALRQVRDQEGKKVWECLCECGNITLARPRSLLSKSEDRRDHRTSCGCVRRMKAKRFPDTEWGNFYSKLSEYVTRAKKRGIEWHFNEEEAMALFTGDCYYCGCRPSAIREQYGKEVFVHNGIDRLYSNEGYTLTNSVSCCANCNYLKMDMPADEFLSLIARIFLNVNKKTWQPQQRPQAHGLEPIW